MGQAHVRRAVGAEAMGFVRRLTATALFFACFKFTYSFPDGAPAEACDSLLPRHAGTSPSPVAESPYVFVASDDKYSYKNPQPIKVEIYGAPFKGFLVAAVDPHTGERIGNWIKGKGTGILPCAAITHSDGRDKKHVILIWTPPKDKAEGNVVFVATVLRSKSLYYTGQVAGLVGNAAYRYYY
ncbi:putative defense protein 1 [Centruroides vittatus]|uniref:putative defense protein 1 n=1 Tax=Centruroides vittatus TaxID=120091 RepID=UPI00350F8400